MHILEKYALNTGAKIGKPYIYDKFFPLDVDKYITFHCAEHQSKFYEYWQEVIDLIHPPLKEMGITIIQLGGAKDISFGNCLVKNGITSYSQSAYIIKRSMLHFGADSFLSQIASASGKKVVSVFSHVLPQHKRPYWSDDKDSTCIAPELNDGEKPSYSYYEPDKNINKIKPEKIAEEILKLLGKNLEYNFSTEWLGPEYNKDYIDIIPNTTPRDYNAKFELARIRMDLNYNVANLHQNLEQGNKLTIITNNPIDPELLRAYKKKILSFIFIWDEETKDENLFIQDLLSMGIEHCSFVTFLDKEVADKIKLHYMDFCLVLKQDLLKQEDCGVENLENLYFKSSKRILSNKKYYSSLYHYYNDIPTGSFNKSFKPVVDDKDFWRDINYFNISKKLD
tara:strand:- start:14849 stop:16033 length:1185 start_codon:yes stop_codon:yes gene_type:complete